MENLILLSRLFVRLGFSEPDEAEGRQVWYVITRKRLGGGSVSEHQ